MLQKPKPLLGCDLHREMVVAVHPDYSPVTFGIARLHVGQLQQVLKAKLKLYHFENMKRCFYFLKRMKRWQTTYKLKEAQTAVDEDAAFFDLKILTKHSSICAPFHTLRGFQQFKITSLPSSRMQGNWRHKMSTHVKPNSNIRQPYHRHTTRRCMLQCQKLALSLFAVNLWQRAHYGLEKPEKSSERR